MIAWFAKNDVAANLLMVALVISGALALKYHTRIETFPSSDPDTVSVSVSLRGATPEDMERGVAQRIEESIADLEGVERITSTSSEGRSSVTVEIDEDYDPRELLADIKSRVDSINTFPADAEKPIVSLAQREYSVIDVVLTGDVADDELRNYAEKVHQDVIRLPGVTRANISFSRNFEISVEISKDKLRQYGLSLSDLSKAIDNSSLDVSAGNLRSEGGDILIRSKGQAYQQQDFQNIVLKTNADGTLLTLGDLADVNDGFEEDNVVASFNGDRAIMVQVYRVGRQNALEVGTVVKEYVAKQQSSLPQSIKMSYWDDESEGLKERISALLFNMLSGGILVFLMLALFLRPAVAGWVFIGIPIAFLASFTAVAAGDISINLISLYGFILVLGLVVDDAIVTGESIYAQQSKTSNGLEAAIQGAQKVAMPVTFGVMTTIAAFLPMFFLEGRMANIMAPIPAVVIPVLLFSLVESKFVLPAHLKYLKPKKEKDLSGFGLWQQRFANNFEKAIVTYYRPLLVKAIEQRYSVLFFFMGMLALVFVLLSNGWLHYTTFPRIPADTIRTNLVMPVGTPFVVTDRNIQKIAAAAEDLREKYKDDEGNPAVKQVLSITGGRGGEINSGYVFVETDVDVLTSMGKTAQELLGEWRDSVGDIVGAESLSYRAELFRFGDPIDIQFSATSFQSLERVAEKTKEHLASYPTVFDIADSMSSGKQELQIELTEQGELLGLRRADVLATVAAAFRGIEAQRIQRGRDDIRVIVRLPLAERGRYTTLNELLIDTPAGGRVPLSQVAEFKPSKGPSEIKRIDRFRVLNVTADYNKAETNSVVLNNSLREYLDKLIVAYPDVEYSLEGEEKEAQKTYGSMVYGIIGMLFIIYCLLALPMGSYGQPLVVMSVIPFSLIGAVLGHFLMGAHMTFHSYLGVMALIGIVVNDSLVLVDFINQERKAGQGVAESILNAGVSRFRAVMLTSLTTFIGILPMMLGTSPQAQFLIPMAISLGFGVLFATFITLILVPVIMLIANDLKKRLEGTTKSGYVVNH